MASERSEPEVEEAGQVFLLMKKDYRISRNVRLAWFLNHLHQTVQATPQEMLLQSEQELEVLSVLPPGWQPDEPVVPRPFLLVPSTRVTFLAWQYRFVIELDLSPSTGIVDDSTGEILFDEVFHALSRCLGGLLQPFRVPGSCIDFQPEIYITIQAYSSIIGLQSHQVLVQGCLLNPSQQEVFLQQIYEQLCLFEDKVATMLQQQYDPQSQVGGVYSYDCSFGHVPNVELMKFIAMATFGSYLSTCPEPEPGNLGLTVYHRAFLLYSFLRSGEALNPEYYCGSQHRLFNEHLVSASSNPALALRRKKHTEKEVPADLVSTVSVRLREGYSVREVTVAKGGSQLEVKLVLLWKHNMRIEYVAVASWPLELEGPRVTRVEVTMEGGYDILHDVSCALRQPIRSLYRTHVIRRFWNTLQSINQTDQMLAHLQSFSSVPEHFTLPDSTKSGVPLFYIPPGSTTPVLSLQPSGSDSSHAQFAAYWKPVLSMDTNSWQRWLHMHRLVLILEHDTPIPKHLHTPGSNGRYSTIQCRISHSSLTSLLRDWSSFVLVEGYSYVKLLSSAPDQPPSSFYMVRIISKAPCMVLRLGFPIGTPAPARHKIVSGLREEILRLRFPHRVQSKEPTPKVKRKGLGGIGGGSSPSKSPPVLGPQQTLSDRPCLVVLHKPLDKLLIRYEKLPLDYRAPFLLTLEPPGPLPLVSGRSASSSLASLSRYLYHQRWLWSVPSGLAPALPLSAIAHLLSILTEVRLSEGFHFACSGEGIINMVLELPIQNEPPGQAAAEEKHTCVVQYILFPPHSTSTKDSFSTDDDNDVEVEALEGDSELNLVTEVWVEPQYGRVGPGPGSWKHLQDLTYSEIPQALHPRDAACIGSMLSFEYLIQLCQSKEWGPLPQEPRISDGLDQGGDTCVHEIPFHFDLMGLLPQCQQLQMFFLLLSRDVQRLAACGLEGPLQEETKPKFGDWSGASSLKDLGETGVKATKSQVPVLSVTLACDNAQNQGELSPPFRRDLQPYTGRQPSQTDSADGPRTRCPVYIYSCSLEALREQMVGMQPPQAPRDLIFRTQFLDHPSPTSAWMEPRYKEAANHCALLQEHAQRCYVRGLFRSLQQAQSVTSQDLLTAVDACEEILQEVDITPFLLALCGHTWGLPHAPPSPGPLSPGPFSSSMEEGGEPRERAILASESSIETEDLSEPEFQSTCVPGNPDPGPEISLTDVCQLRGDAHGALHSIIQEKFLEISRLHFRTVPSNPHYFFYCPPSSRREDEGPHDTVDRKISDLEFSEAELMGEEGDTSACCVVTESDPELEVEYRESRESDLGPAGLDSASLSDADTVNPDEDSFSILGGDSPTGPESLLHDLPPLFLHLTCSVRLRGQHSSVPVCSLPTCLGQVLSSLEGPTVGGRVPLRDLSVTLDVFVLTLPLEVELPTASDPQHHRSTSESSASFPRSPGQPSSLRSDDGLGPPLPLPEEERHPGLSNLATPHRLAIETTMNEIRWLLEDEMVGALRRGGIPQSPALHRAAAHIHSSPGRSTCLRQTLPLSFVFGPERSLTQFKEEFRCLHLPGHVLLEDPDSGFFFVAAGQQPHGSHEEPSSAAWAWHSPEDKAEGIEGETLTVSPQAPGSPEDSENAPLISLPSLPQGGSQPGPSRGLSLMSSQGSVDSDQLGYDGGSSGSDSEGPIDTLGEKAPFTLRTPSGPAPPQPSLSGLPGPCLPDFWLIVRVLQDRVEVYAHARSLIREDGGPGTECRHLQQLLVRRVGEICREVNQRLLLQDLHDSHVCNSLLVAESEEDLWRSETPFHSRQRAPLPSDDYAADESCAPRGYLAATMQFVPGHFSCDVVWGTVIRVHSRLKMGPSMGVSRAIQALRSVLNAFSVVNRKNMFVYQERATKAVYYLRLLETSCSDRPWKGDVLPPSLALSRSQEPIYSEEASGPRSPLDMVSSRSSDAARPVGQVDRHIQLLVHGVGQAGPEITDELVRVLRRRLDEATLDVITVMLVRNCKLTPADVEFIQPPGSLPSEVLHLALPTSCRPWLPALAWYLRQNLLIFLHSPKYTDSNSQNHFQHPLPPQGGLPDLDIYLYNKPGGQGTGGKGVACITLAFVDEGGAPLSLALWPPSSPGPPDLLREEEFEQLTQVIRCPVILDSSSAQNGAPRLRLDVWEKGNISIVQLEEKLRGAARQALADAIFELQLLPASLCTEDTPPGSLRSGSLETKSSAGRASTFPPAPVPGEPVTPPSKAGRRSFWDMLSKTECGDLGSPKTTDDIVLDRPEDTRGRRRHKTESVRTPGGAERAPGSDSGAQRQRRRTTQLEEGEVGTLHPVFACIAQRWMEFMVQIGCASVSRSSTHMVSRFLLPSVLSEFTALVTSMAVDTSVRLFEQHLGSEPEIFSPCFPGQLGPSPHPAAERHLLLLGRNFLQWRRPTQQAAKSMQRFEPGGDGSSGRNAPRQRLLLLEVMDKKLQLLTYNWAPDLGAALGRALVRLVQWQNARAHLIFCLLSQKLGLFHHYGQLDFPVRDEKEPNPFLLPTMEVETLIRSASPPLSREQGRLSGSSRSGGPLPLDTFPFDEALRDITAARPSSTLGPVPRPPDPVTYHGQQFLEIKMAERRELERQMKMENLFVTWQQRSTPASMPISAGELETLKQSSRLVHYCATALLFDPAAWLHGPPETSGPPEGQRRHRPESGSGSREAPASCESLDVSPPGAREEPWLKELSLAFLQQYVQYLQSIGFVLVPLRPPSPTRSTSRPRAMAILGTEGRGSFSCPKIKTDGSPKSTSSPVTTYHLQRALPGGIILMELVFQGCYFCVKQFALECSRIPMGQAVNSQLSMLFTEECDKVRDLMHVHSFSYDFHLRLVHQHVLGAHLVLRHGYHLTTFLRHFLAHHPDGPHFGRNHIYQGTLELPTPLIAAHQLYNYVADHASSYHMKPLRMARPGGPEHNEYALVSAWHSSGSYLDSEGLRHQDDFDVSLLVCHCAAPFEEQGEAERHILRLQFFVVLTSQRELFPRLTTDMRRFRKPPRLPPEPEAPGSSAGSPGEGPGLVLAPGPAPLFPPLAAEVGMARARLAQLVRLAGGHCRRDTLWKRLFLLEPPGPDRLRLGGRLALAELEELLEAVHAKSIGDIDPQLDCFLSMTVSWYQSLIKVLLSRFPQSCRHFQSPDLGTQYLVVLNQKFTDCFVLVFLDSHLGKTSLTVVFREPFPVQPQDSESPPAQLVSTYHHLESVINTACFTLWTRLL
uniref:SZT2 subunit of KICSTOR complex n=1 Tax=Callithrix jacchus TaxID=9483 RepID=A0A8I3X6X9_CALJA